MFVVIYSWRIKSGKEDQFQRAWATRTEEILSQMGGLGSRLHRGEDGSFIAYAQWPSREAWEAAGSKPQLPSLAQTRMQEATESVQTLSFMEVIEDKLIQPNGPNSSP